MTLTDIQPMAGVGAVVFHNNKVLLVKRGQPPCQNEWAIPGGRIKLGESLQQAAEREVYEETGITVKAGEAIFSFDLIEKDKNAHILFHYVIVDLVATYIKGKIKASSDASNAGWFGRSELTSLHLNKTTENLLRRFSTFTH